MTREEAIKFLTAPASVVHLDDPSYFDILLLLFPTLTIDETPVHQDRFIVKYDVTSQTAMFNYKAYCRNFIIISNRLFDFNLSKDDFLLLAVEWRRMNLSSRVRTLVYESDDSHEDLFHFIKNFVHLGVHQDEKNILELFDSVGTGLFQRIFLEQCKATPPNVLIKSVTTFLKKATQQSSSLYYKRAYVRLSKKINDNLVSATRELCLTESYSSEMDFINFHNHLFSL